MIEMKEGVYFHEKKGLAIAELKGSGDNWGICWRIDKNKRKRHPVFNVMIDVVETLTGEYFFNKSLKGYEYIGEFDSSINTKGKPE